MLTGTIIILPFYENNRNNIVFVAVLSWRFVDFKAIFSAWIPLSILVVNSVDPRQAHVSKSAHTDLATGCGLKAACLSKFHLL